MSEKKIYILIIYISQNSIYCSTINLFFESATPTRSTSDFFFERATRYCSTLDIFIESATEYLSPRIFPLMISPTASRHGKKV